MRRAELIRSFGNDKECLGSFSVIGDKGIELLCKSLELPWKNNQSKISCIPAGEYNCVWAMSPRLGRMTYRIENVPGRDGILFHPANKYFELLGCIALGDALKDLNADGQMDVIHSGDTIKKFETLMAALPFKFKIIQTF